MTTIDYRPIACDLYSEYEVMAMHRLRVRLRAVMDDGSEQVLLGRVVDIRTRDGAEFLALETAAGEVLSLRLDRLLAVEPASE